MAWAKRRSQEMQKLGILVGVEENLLADATVRHPVFVVTNGEVIGKSEMYSSVAAIEAEIASVKANATGAATKVLEG